MSKKIVHLFIVDGGDPKLQLLLEKGLSEIGHGFEKTSIGADPASVLDALNDERVPVVIKPL